MAESKGFEPLIRCRIHNAAVKIESIDVAETIKTTKALIEAEASLSLDFKEALDQHCS
jgi:hypothetical protein